MGIKEGKWKCSFCGAVNLGRNAKCQECQGVRGDDVEFFLDDDAAEVSDENLVNAAKAGADWSCDYCQTDNRAIDEKCRQCGAMRSDGGKDRKQKVILDNAGSEAVKPQVKAKVPPPKKAGSKSALFIAGGVVILIVILLYIFVFRTTKETLVVESGVWERSIGLEEEVLVTKEAWDQDVPRNASILSSREKQSGTEKYQTGTERVKVGKKDLGNGFFEDVYEDRPVYEERPVYDTWVTYRVWEWQEYKRVAANGTLQEPPAWPTYTLKTGGREGSKQESASLTLYSSKNKEKKYKYSLKPDRLKEFSIGKGYIGKINAVGAVLSLEKEK